MLNSTGLQSVLLVFIPYEKLITAFKFLRNKVLNETKGSVPLCRNLPEALEEWERHGVGGQAPFLVAYWAHWDRPPCVGCGH